MSDWTFGNLTGEIWKRSSQNRPNSISANDPKSCFKRFTTRKSINKFSTSWLSSLAFVHKRLVWFLFLGFISSIGSGCASLGPLQTAGIRNTDIVVDNFVFNSRQAGPKDGELVILLHGFPETSLQWRAQLRALGDSGYFAVAPDQRGYSPRARPLEIKAYDYNLLIDDVLAIASALGRDQFHLVGHDWGAIVAWGIAAREPQRLKSLTVLSIPHPDAFADALTDPESCQYDASSYFETLTEDSIASWLLAFNAFALRTLVWGDIHPDAKDAYLKVLGTEEALNAALNWYRANLSQRQFRHKQIGAISVDTLFVASDSDANVCPEPIKATAKYVTGPYRLETLSNIDHWIPERAPKRVNKLLLEHLGKNSFAIKDR